MTIIKKDWNWSDDEGNHIGGQSIGESYTIAWQRGPLKESGRNGAFLIEVLEALMDITSEWITPDESKVNPIAVTGIGFTVFFSEEEDQRMMVLESVFNSCISQISYYQSQTRFACDENIVAIDNLIIATAAFPNLHSVASHLALSIQALVSRRDRRDNAGTLGTHLPEP